MAAVHSQSFCIIHPDSEFEDPKFSFGDSHVKINASESGGRNHNVNPLLAAMPAEADAVTFDRVFAPKTSQEKVFQVIAKAAVVAALEKFASAAFLALGATGGGKTFTVTGGAKRFADRGLIPRSISALFEALCARPDRDELEVSVSFYELYKDGVVDLLSEKRRRVTLQPGENGPVLVGLLKQAVATESDAYHLLFQGDSNRHFERLPMNAETSRGHVFYVLHLSHPRSGRKATLSFADLAAVVNTRNQATASIAQSLDALRACVAAMRSGSRPAFEATALTQLLQPWMRPHPGSDPVHLALISPIRYLGQMQTELRDWLLFAKEFREAMGGPASEQDRLDSRGGPQLPGFSPDWRGSEQGLSKLPDRAFSPEQLVPPLPRHPDGPFAPLGSSTIIPANGRPRQEAESMALPRRPLEESSSPALADNLPEKLQAVSVAEDKQGPERQGAGSTPAPALASSSTLLASASAASQPQSQPQSQPRSVALSAALQPTKPPVSVGLLEGTSTSTSGSTLVQMQAQAQVQGQARSSVAAPVGISSGPGLFASSSPKPFPAASMQRSTASVTSIPSSAIPSSAALGSLAAPAAAPAGGGSGTGKSRSVSPQPRAGALSGSPMGAATLLPARSVDASWGASSRASSRSSSPMASWGGDSYAVTRTNVYAQPQPQPQPAHLSHLSQPVGSGASVLSAMSQPQGRLPLSNVYAQARPVSPQPQSRTSGSPQQAWSPQPAWKRTATPSRSSSPQPCTAAQSLVSGHPRAATRSLSPQSQAQAPATLLPGALTAAPAGPLRHPSPLPMDSHSAAAVGSYAAPARQSGLISATYSPVAGTKKGLQLDRAPTPLRVPLAGGGFV